MSLVWAAAQMLKRHGNSIKEFDLAFSLAVPTCILVSYHTLEHDLVLLSLPFAIVFGSDLCALSLFEILYLPCLSF